jgi:hypothetical protein
MSGIRQGDTVWFQLRKMRPHIESIAESLAKLTELLETQQNTREGSRGRKATSNEEIQAEDLDTN